ncbi:MAG TPA: hypothetical protein VFQ50_07135 [Flavobacterium sp.]|nr:hypothetical protein [Flavobacterium sp.]
MVDDLPYQSKVPIRYCEENGQRLRGCTPEISMGLAMIVKTLVSDLLGLL